MNHQTMFNNIRKDYIEVKKNEGQNIVDRKRGTNLEKILNIKHLIIYFLDSKILFLKG